MDGENQELAVWYAVGDDGEAYRELEEELDRESMEFLDDPGKYEAYVAVMEYFEEKYRLRHP